MFFNQWQQGQPGNFQGPHVAECSLSLGQTTLVVKSKALEQNNSNSTTA